MIAFSSKHICAGTLFGLGFFWFVLMTNLHSRENPITLQNTGEKAGETEKDLRIQATVEEVRLDAVVLQKGHQVTDLTADDFDIYQDGRLQQITSCIYISEYQPQPQAKADTSRDSRAVPLIPGPMLKREDVRRTFVFVVDNLAMPFDDVHRARMGLRRFAENEMQPGDLVAVLQTAGGNAAMQMFTSDKRILLEKISKVQWILDTRTLTHAMPEPMAISYFIRALQDMPGRKYMILITPDVMVHSSMKDAFNALADAALRTGVVIHTLSSAGLKYDVETIPIACSINDEACLASIQKIEKPLSKKTGGLILNNENWMVTKSGIGSVSEEIKGYYLLSYIPPAETFREDPQGTYHRIRIKVKRSGYEVHTRDGFLGISRPAFASAGNSDSLKSAIFSPFQKNSLNVNLASGYINDPQKGYLLKSWLHVDGNGLSAVGIEDGSMSILLEAACVTSSMDDIQDSGSGRYEFLLKKEDVPWVKEHGLNFSLVLPVKNPRAYYVRAAVKEPRSGKIGSAYQFIEIPDLKKRHLALSNIFFINREEDLPWAESRTPEQFTNLLSPDKRRDPRKSPALRSYLPGENIECAAVIYNAESGKGQKPNLESQIILFGDGKQIFKSEPAPVDLSNVGDLNRIPIRKRLFLNNSLQPGDYVLLLQVNEIHAGKSNRIAKQALDFKVLPK